jgi:hypothetical protein
MTDTRQHRTLEAQSSSETPVIWADGPTTGAATNVEMVNNTKTLKWVRVTGGTSITAISVGPPGATVAIAGAIVADGFVPVRAGHALKIAHSGAPSLQWFES